MHWGAATAAAVTLLPASAARAVPFGEDAVASLGGAALRLAADGETGPNFPCVARAFDPMAPPDAEGWGPTDVNAQTANGRLAAGVSRSATLTVLRWPSPSYYDQIKYYTVDRRLPLLGAKPNEGAFLGVVVGGRTLWLRDFPRSRQRYPTSRGDEVITEFSDPARRLRVVVRDVAPRGVDALIRRVEVRSAGARRAVRPRALVAFENFNLVVSKLPAAPLLDFCNEELNADSARYLPGADAIVHERSGVDASTGKRSSVAVAMAFARRSAPAKLARVRRGIDWIAHVEATPDTHVLGETWRVARGRVLTYTATPHLWEHTLFYLAMLETYGAER